MTKTRDLLRDKWASLGIAFHVESDINANPEETIIDTIQSGEFPEDKKLFELMLLWIEEYGALLHVERFKSLLTKLSAFELALLGGIASKCLAEGDYRWKTIIKDVQKKLGVHPVTFQKGDDPLYLKLKGTDQDFINFGIKVAPLRAENHKKLLSRDSVLKKNAWLKNRLLWGANLRADFITVFTLKLAENAYQAAKVLQCSNNASYRNWRDLDEAKRIGILSEG